MNSRRRFIKKVAALATGMLTARESLLWGAEESDKLGAVLPQRPFGNTGMDVTLFTLGGRHVGVVSEREARKIIDAALEQGVRVFENARAYFGGMSEERYGKFLTPKFRDQVYLFTKTRARSASEAREELEGSLKRMRTDRIDLYQMHSIDSPQDVDSRLRNGVLDYMLKAKEQGKIRHIGFTGHRTYTAHLRMLEVAPEVESCLMPINVADPSFESFIENVLPELQKRNLGIQAMKTLGNGGLMGGKSGGRIAYGSRSAIIPNRLSVADALRFVWSLPISTLVSGVDSADQLKENIETLRNLKAMTADEQKAMIDRVADIASTGEMEWYKRPGMM